MNPQQGEVIFEFARIACMKVTKMLDCFEKGSVKWQAYFSWHPKRHVQKKQWKILEELGDGHFAITIDESRNISCKQQIVVVLQYVDRMSLL